jgi:hypothetical protein
MNTNCAADLEPFEPYATSEGYYAIRNNEGTEVLYGVYGWTEQLLPNVIQQAIVDTRSDIIDTLQSCFHMRHVESRQQALALTGAWGCDDWVWAVDALSLEREGREVLAALQKAKLHLDNAVHCLQYVARLEDSQK